MRTSLERHPEDLFLACACHAADAAALSAFERELLAPAIPSLLRFDPSSSFVDDVVQDYRAKLFTGSTPRIASYSGTGPLQLWVRVGLTRVAIDHLRRNTLHDDSVTEIAEELWRDTMTPELQLLSATYQTVLKSAVHAVIERLPVRDKNLLRFHFLDGLSIDRIAVVYQIHRATVARQVVRLRRELLRAVQHELADAGYWSQGSSGVGKIWRLAGSDIQLSLERLLRASLDSPRDI